MRSQKCLSVCRSVKSRTHTQYKAQKMTDSFPSKVYGDEDMVFTHIARPPFLTIADEALTIYRTALEAVRSDTLIKNAIKFNGNKLFVTNWLNKATSDKDVELDLQNKSLHIVGGGKSVLLMATALLDQIKNESRLNSTNVNGCLSLPVGIKSFLDTHLVKASNLFEHFNIKCHYGAKNNLPDQDSVQATKNIIKLINDACDGANSRNADPLFILLLSGGGSACLSSPKLVDLNEKLDIIRSLVSNGVDIVELNTVRRCLSEVKGGRLASQILKRNKNAKIITLIVSDVIGDRLEFIASGPTFLRGDEGLNDGLMALDILNKYSVSISPMVRESLRIGTSSTSTNALKEKVHNFIIGNNSLALNAAMNQADLLGYQIECLGNRLQGDVDSILECVLEKAAYKFKQNHVGNKLCIIGGGEATVELKIPDGGSPGIGGRAQEMALRYLAKDIDKILLNSYEDVFLAAGTDGQDGPTPYAGCLSSSSRWEHEGHSLYATREDILHSLARHDSSNFWLSHKKEWLIETGLTGTNVMDIYLILLSNNEIKSNC